MDRTALKQFILSSYPAEADHPWLSHPDFEVFRHSNNRKWFALVMDIPQSRLGLQGEDVVDVVNLKCDPILIGSLRGDTGVFPAYHMSKASWITVILDGSVPEEKLKMLLDLSYELTSTKKRRSKPSNYD